MRWGRNRLTNFYPVAISQSEAWLVANYEVTSEKPVPGCFEMYRIASTSPLFRRLGLS
jgi:hypothetical protein